MKTDGGTGALDQMIVAEYFSVVRLRTWTHLSACCASKLDTMVEAVEREFGTAVEMWKPEGGIFLWLKLPDGWTCAKLVKPAGRAGIAFNPGPEWVCNPRRRRSSMRLCFALPSKQQIRDGVAALARVVLRADRHSACAARTWRTCGVARRADSIAGRTAS